MDIAPPTPDYARFEAAKLLGRLEQANPQWGGNLPAITAAAARAHWSHLHRDDQIPDEVSDPGGYREWRNAQLDGDEQREFGHYVAMQALGHGVSWFDDHAEFELHVPSVEFELE